MTSDNKNLPYFFLILMIFISEFTLHAQQKKTYSKEIEFKIKQVENNLSGWLQIKDKPQKWTLEERMLFYKANGVSIAVVKDYKIEWAKGYVREPKFAWNFFVVADVYHST